MMMSYDPVLHILWHRWSVGVSFLPGLAGILRGQRHVWRGRFLHFLKSVVRGANGCSKKKKKDLFTASTFLRNKLVMKLVSSPRFYVSRTHRPHYDLILLLEKDCFRDNQPIVR